LVTTQKPLIISEILIGIKMISTGRSNYPEILKKNQKQELPLAAIFVGGMGRNEETL
jgi:hypothetical protein